MPVNKVATTNIKYVLHSLHNSGASVYLDICPCDIHLVQELHPFNFLNNPSINPFICIRQQGP